MNNLELIRYYFLGIFPVPVFLIAYLLAEKGTKPWIPRKIIHIFGLSIIGIYIVIIPKLTDGLFVILIFTIHILLLNSMLNIQIIETLLKKTMRKETRDIHNLLNVLITLLTIIIISIITYSDPFILLGVIISFAFGDGLGEILGRSIGKHEYHIFAKKTIEGSLGVFIGTLFGIISSLIIFNQVTYNKLILILVISLGITIIEGLFTGLIENLSILSGLTFSLYLLY